MKETLKILKQVAAGELKNNIDVNSNIDLERFSSLVDKGYIDAIDATDSECPEFLEPKITIAGREYLEANKENNNKINIDTNIFDEAKSWKRIEKIYQLSKKTFGRRINFVKDKNIRLIIFRDTAQAFSLEEKGYFKPSIILAGGIIEELLRQYLNSKDISPLKDTLDSYINCCKEHNLLGKAIENLTHYIRLSRNLVHIQRESKDYVKIDKALANSIVSSIISVVNNF